MTALQLYVRSLWVFMMYVLYERTYCNTVGCLKVWTAEKKIKAMFWKLEQLRRIENNDNRCYIVRLIETMFFKFELWEIFEIKIDRWCILTLLKRCTWSLSCWEKFEIMVDRWFILALFETMFWKLEQQRRFESNGNRCCILRLFQTMFWRLELLRKNWNHGRYMVHSDDVLDVWAPENLKAMTRHAAFRHSLKRCFGRSNCLDKIESEGVKWCIMTLFETMFLKLEMLRKNWKQGDEVVHANTS